MMLSGNSVSLKKGMLNTVLALTGSNERDSTPARHKMQFVMPIQNRGKNK